MLQSVFHVYMFKEFVSTSRTLRVLSRREKTKQEKQVVTFLQHRTLFYKQKLPFHYLHLQVLYTKWMSTIAYASTAFGKQKDIYFCPTANESNWKFEVLWLQAHAHVIILAPTFCVHLWALVQVKKKILFECITSLSKAAFCTFTHLTDARPL